MIEKQSREQQKPEMCKGRNVLINLAATEKGVEIRRKAERTGFWCTVVYIEEGIKKKNKLFILKILLWYIKHFGAFLG